jgi:hypothetical protein
MVLLPVVIEPLSLAGQIRCFAAAQTDGPSFLSHWPCLLQCVRDLNIGLSGQIVGDQETGTHIPEPSLFGSFESCDPSADKSIIWRTPLEGGFGKPENGVVPARVVSGIVC